jgi:hypothetical protein
MTRLVLSLCLALLTPAAMALDAIVGGAPVTLPEPKGYVDAAGVSAQLRDYGQTLAPQSNRVIAFFVQKEDQQRIAGKQVPQLKRYHMVQVNRGQEAGAMTLAQFEEFRALIRNQAESGPKAGPASVLGVFEDRATAISFLSSVANPPQAGGKAPSLPVIVASSVVLVKGKPLFLNTYFVRHAEADVDAARQAARAWLLSVEMANPLLKK